MTGPFTVGIDLSSRAIDLVRLDENQDEAEWRSVNLSGADAWTRTLDLRGNMPTSLWWDEVYLCAIEKPFGPSRRAQSVLMRVQGAILASIPSHVELWEVDPATWKKALGLKQSEKPSWSAFPPSFFDDYWDQNARDALGVALYARDENARGVAAALNHPTGKAAA